MLLLYLRQIVRNHLHLLTLSYRLRVALSSIQLFYPITPLGLTKVREVLTKLQEVESNLNEVVLLV
jgi:hypothetical protein